MQFSEHLHIINSSTQIWTPKLAELFGPNWVRQLPALLAALKDSARLLHGLIWYAFLSFSTKLQPNYYSTLSVNPVEYLNLERIWNNLTFLNEQSVFSRKSEGD